MRRAALGAGAGRVGRWASRRRAVARDTGRHAGRRAQGAGGARGRRAAAALGRAGGRGAQALGRQALGRQALGRWGVRALAGARLGARCARGTAGRQYGRAACARRLGQLGQVGVLCTLTRFFGPVRLGIFPESPNEHCSL